LGACEIERLFSESVTKKVTFCSTGRIQSHFGELTIDSIKVQIIDDVQKRLPEGTWEPPPDLSRHKESVKIGGMRVPVLSMEYEYQAYLKLGRTDKARMLREWLAGKRTI